jgi:hypothetical protein
MASPVDQPSEERLFKAAAEQALLKIQTSLPGIVKEYDPIKRVALVQPAVYADQPFEPISASVNFPGAGDLQIEWPLAVGDEVELHFSKLDPSRFQVTGEESQANYVRPGGLYATCTPCWLSDAKRELAAPIVGGLTLGTRDGLTRVVIAPNSIKLGSDLAALPVAIATLQDAINAAMAVWGAAHTHTSTAPGFPTSPPITPPPAPPPVGSLKTAVDM